LRLKQLGSHWEMLFVELWNRSIPAPARTVKRFAVLL
jgi:hypothetical protein